MLFLYLWNSFKTLNSNRSFSLSKFNFLKMGSVWELYLLFDMIRTARFCSLSRRPGLKPQDNIEYCKWGIIIKLYSIRRKCVGKKFFKRHMIPNVLAILFEIFWMWGFQLRCSSIVSPRKLNSMTLSIGSKFIFSVGIILVMFRW